MTTHTYIYIVMHSNMEGIFDFLLEMTMPWYLDMNGAVGIFIIIVVFCSVIAAIRNVRMKPSPKVTRAALGRAAEIGALYDIRTDSFLNGSLFQSTLGDGVIQTTQIVETVIDQTLSDSLQEKFKQLGVEPELQASVLLKMVKLTGSGAYLEDERCSARSQRMSLIYKLTTVHEEITVSQMRDKIDLDTFSRETGEATHVVVAIDWGAYCCVTCEYDNIENNDDTTVEGILSSEINRLREGLDGEGPVEVPVEDKAKEIQKCFTFRCRADFPALDKDISVTFESALELARALPQHVCNAQNGKGVPLTYYLMPLEYVFKTCKSGMNQDIQYSEVNEGTAKECVEALVNLSTEQKKAHYIHQDMQENDAFIPAYAMKRIDNIVTDLRTEESRFRAAIRESVKSVRSGLTEVADLDQIIHEQNSKTNSTSQYDDAIETCQQDLNKASEIKLWRKRGIRYLGKRGPLKKTVFIFYKTEEGKEKNNLERNERFFLRLHETYGRNCDYEFTVVDQALSPEFWPNEVKSATIEKWEHGQLISQDLYNEEDPDVCTIRIGKTTSFTRRPENRAYVELRCPNALSGNGQCEGNPVIWRCMKCRKLIEYDIDSGQFYCKCGQSEPKEAMFRCNDTHHSMNFFSYPAELLQSELSHLNAVKVTNILILGETGVGKSTWINAFQNYLHFEDLHEAMESDIQVLIPSSFSFTDENGQRDIFVGEHDPNEVLKAGQSATKEPRSYIFDVGKERVCLIDTPGIGDSGGLQEDKKNIDKILSHLTYYDEIHAVCILLKPNNSRLTALFRFCIQELLVQLHNSAKDNIVFCFTNARGTFYRPGDTLPALNEMLSDRNVGIQATQQNCFCFDNEPFRFLSCVVNGIKFDKVDIDTYANSWVKSVEVTCRLLEYIKKNLKPHKTTETLGMNEARRRIVAMSKPLAEVAKVITQNVREAEEAKKQIDLVTGDIRSLEENLKFSGFGVELVHLDFPRTVCAHENCVKYLPVGTDRVLNTVYNQICHDHCYLTGIPTQTINNPKLFHCRGMLNGKCKDKKCGHDYTRHMHITYDTKVTETEFLSPQTQEEIQKKGDIKAQKEEAKRAIDEKIAELKEEEAKIMGTAAKFGSFIKANALIAFNDAVADYLDMSIEQEQSMRKETRNEMHLKKMKQMKEEYNKQIAILDEAINTGAGENVRTPAQVKELQEELFQLKHFGKTLKKLFEEVSISNSAGNKTLRETVAQTPSNRKKIGFRKRATDFVKSFLPQRTSTAV